MQARVMRIRASVGSTNLASATSSMRTSPALCMTVALIFFSRSCLDRGWLRLGNLFAEALEGDAVGVGPAADSRVERIDGDDLLAGELEVEDVEVLGDAAGLGRFRDCRAPLLQM